MSKVQYNSVPKMILDACWGEHNRSPFLAKPVYIFLDKEIAKKSFYR